MSSLLLLVVLLLGSQLAAGPASASRGSSGRLRLLGPTTVAVFEGVELEMVLPSALSQQLGSTQILDAYDADRDGRWLRIEAVFINAASGQRQPVPGFAMRTRPAGPWHYRVRWAARRAGAWAVEASAVGSLGGGKGPFHYRFALGNPLMVRRDRRISGPLVVPRQGRYLRELRPDGSTRARWLFGACRAWNTRGRVSSDPRSWAGHSFFHAERELLGPLRTAGYNLLNQWMANWEYLLVHRDRAEFWRNSDQSWQRHPLPPSESWAAFAAIDQGRARAFDRWIERVEGDARRKTLYLLLSPLPHQALQMSMHPWGGNESGWSLEDDKRGQLPQKLNGFSAFRPKMSVWSFFSATPMAPRQDWRSRLFDHQANYFRYLIARWAYSRAIGVWVLIDELDAIGDEVGVMSAKTGWWKRPEPSQWLAHVIRLFRGQLRRKDGLRYVGDPYAHPIHSATTSFDGNWDRGGNLDWTGTSGAAPDLLGWHLYPQQLGKLPQGWLSVVDAIVSYAQAPNAAQRPRLISEFGAPDRRTPLDSSSPIYPALYHYAIWAAIFSGQAGTVMDWDDGKEFGEIRFRKGNGPFSKKRYPIDLTQRMVALRNFLKGIDPGDVYASVSRGASVSIDLNGKASRALGLYSKSRDKLYAWVFSASRSATLTVSGLLAGQYDLRLFDTWTGRPLGRRPVQHTVGDEGNLVLSLADAFSTLAARARTAKPRERLARGFDLALKLVRVSSRAADEEPSHQPIRPTVVGKERPALLFVPDTVSKRRTHALIVVLHGYGSEPLWTLEPLDAAQLIGEKKAFLLAPAGRRDSAGRRFWRAGSSCCDFDGQGVDDVGYLARLIAQVVREFPIARQRIYVLGHSNGGHMAHRLACSHPNLVRAMVSFAGTLFDPSTCRPPRSVRMLQIQGDADGTVPYGPEDRKRGGGSIVHYPGALNSTKRWARLNGCKQSATRTITDDALRLRITNFAGCQRGGRTELWTILGGDHDIEYLPAAGLRIWHWLEKP